MFFLLLKPLAASDYLQIAQYFHTVIVKEIPRLTLDSKSQARRFITLIDTLYDNRVRVKSDTIPLYFTIQNRKSSFYLVLFRLQIGDCFGGCTVGSAVFNRKNWRWIHFWWTSQIDGWLANIARFGKCLFFAMHFTEWGSELINFFFDKSSKWTAGTSIGQCVYKWWRGLCVPTHYFSPSRNAK